MRKKIISIITICFILISAINYVLGASATYTITDKYIFKNVTNNSSVELFLGTTDNSKYSNATCKVTPNSTNIKTDDYGNKILIFDSNALKNNNSTIKVVRNVTTHNVSTDINEANAGYNISNIYLKPSERVESDNELIIAKAKQLTQNCVDDYSKIKNIFEFVNMSLTYDTSENYRNKGALSALKTGRGVCEEYASLFVALCRASNIPARVISGYNATDMYEGETKDTEFIAHAWAEVYLEDYGWLPVEATMYYTINYKKSVYWDGLFNLEKPTYVFVAINNPEIPQLLYKGIEFVRRESTITLNSKSYFNDISNHWAKNNIESLYDKKVINGYEDGSFRPENSVSRIEFLVMLARSLKHNGNTGYNVSNIYYPKDFVNNWSKGEYDLLMKYYAYSSGDYLNKNGAGYETISYVFGDKIEMNKSITREEVVALISPFMQNTYSKNNPFTDINNSKFKDEILKSYMNNIIKGYEDGTFNPKGNITRAEMSTILDRYTR